MKGFAAFVACLLVSSAQGDGIHDSGDEDASMPGLEPDTDLDAIIDSVTADETPTDCLTHLWNDWSACTKSCGGGMRSRTRHVDAYPTHGGKACPSLAQSELCNQQPCGRDLTDDELEATQNKLLRSIMGMLKDSDVHVGVNNRGDTVHSNDYAALDAMLSPKASESLEHLAEETWDMAKHSIPVYGIKRLSYTHDYMNAEATVENGALHIHDDGEEHSHAYGLEGEDTYYGHINLFGVHHIISCELFCKYYDWCKFGSFDQGLRRCTLGSDSVLHHTDETARKCDSCLSFAKSDPDATDGADIAGFTSVSSEYGVDPRASGLLAGFDTTGTSNQTDGKYEIVLTATDKISCEEECRNRGWCKFGTYGFVDQDDVGHWDEKDTVHHDDVAEAQTATREMKCNLMDWSYLWKLKRCGAIKHTLDQAECHTFAIEGPAPTRRPTGAPTYAPTQYPVPTQSPTLYPTRRDHVPTPFPTPGACACDPLEHISQYTTCSATRNRFGLMAVVVHHRAHAKCDPLAPEAEYKQCRFDNRAAQTNVLSNCKYNGNKKKMQNQAPRSCADIQLAWQDAANPPADGEYYVTQQADPTQDRHTNRSVAMYCASSMAIIYRIDQHRQAPSTCK